MSLRAKASLDLTLSVFEVLVIEIEVFLFFKHWVLLSVAVFGRVCVCEGEGAIPRKW